ncbi:hypothetical protein BDZ45DRAFT_678996 [Acephala macrosclerotiorum]|nr:hypothetical protein BDZ45DRAFT_678996 [Acephala macrosclerotiorum]
MIVWFIYLSLGVAMLTFAQLSIITTSPGLTSLATTIRSSVSPPQLNQRQASPENTPTTEPRLPVYDVVAIVLGSVLGIGGLIILSVLSTAYLCSQPPSESSEQPDSSETPNEDPHHDSWSMETLTES